MRKMPEDFSRFGKHFQESMVQLMLEDRNYCDQITEVLDINFLQSILHVAERFIDDTVPHHKNHLHHHKWHSQRDKIAWLL